MLVIYATLPITFLALAVSGVALLWSMKDRHCAPNGLRPLPVTDGASRPGGVPRPVAVTAPALPPRRNARPSPIHEEMS